VLGRLVSDEAFRRRWWSDPRRRSTRSPRAAATSSCERRALLAVAREEAERFAASLDPCIQKIDLNGGER